jgi:hypothetical protein
MAVSKESVSYELIVAFLPPPLKRRTFANLKTELVFIATGLLSAFETEIDYEYKKYSHHCTRRSWQNNIGR